LIQLPTNAEFDARKEAAWAISNATSGGSHQQIVLPARDAFALVRRLTVSDTKIVTIALEGLRRILLKVM
jgi:hypothetical protein